jgi:type VI secretion system secreted protein Hcp
LSTTSPDRQNQRATTLVRAADTRAMCAMANLDIFLKLDGIDGDSADKGHEKEIDVLSYEQSIDVAVVHSGGGGGAGAGKPKFSGVRFRKHVDVASIPILLACASGRTIAHARFAFRRAPGAVEFYKVTLDNVLVTHVAQRAGTGSQYPLSFEALDAGAADAGFVDEITLDYAQIRWEYQAQDASGRPGATTAGGWDVAANRKL